MSQTKRIVTVGLLIALEVALSRFLSIPTPITRIGFGFFPIALIAIQFGPLWAGVSAALADLLGANLFPQGPYFPGFTFSALLTGLVFGLFLYRKPKTLWRPVAAALLINLAISIGLNTLWLSMMLGKGYLAILPARVTQAAIMIPLQSFTIYTAGYRLKNWMDKL